MHQRVARDRRAPLDDVGRHLRRRTHDQGVVVGDDLLEGRVGVDDDIELLAQELDPRVRDRFADQDLHQAVVTGLSNASNARATTVKRSYIGTIPVPAGTSTRVRTVHATSRRSPTS